MDPIWDSHCHLDLLDQVELALERAREVGIHGVLIPGYGPTSWTRQRRLLSEPSPLQLRGALGWHPWALQAEQSFEFHRSALEMERAEWKASGLVPVAVGEFGLDRSPSQKPSFELQCSMFRFQLKWAQQLQLPVILHLVRADGAAVELLQQCPPPGGVIHAFASRHQMLPRYSELGLSFSFGTGLLKQEKVREALRHAPQERILFETDGPLALQTHFAPPFGPHHLPKIIETASQVLGKSVEWCWSMHRENCRRVLNLPIQPARGVNS